MMYSPKEAPSSKEYSNSNTHETWKMAFLRRGNGSKKEEFFSDLVDEETFNRLENRVRNLEDEFSQIEKDLNVKLREIKNLGKRMKK